MDQLLSAGALNTSNRDVLLSMVGTRAGADTQHAGTTPYGPVPNDEDVGDEIAPQSDAGDDSLEADEAMDPSTPSSPSRKPS
ncbi:MAG: hypothetical protein NVSMB6_03450 [Burkholderiaceae bacterium]